MAEEEKNTQTQAPEASPQGPPSKKNLKWWIIGGCSLLLVLCIITLSIVGILSYFGVKSLQAPVAPIKGQLKAINDGNLEKAYNDYCSAGFKQATSFGQFKQVVESNPSIFKSKSSSFTDVQIKDNSAVITGSITGTDNTVTKMRYDMVKEDGKWKILGFKKE